MYQLDWKVIPPDPELAATGRCDDVGVPWTMGVRTTKTVKQPVRCDLHPKHGRKMRDVFLTGVPLFSDRLVDAIRSTGVDNFECYAAEVKDLDGTVHADYKAVNIVGAVRCANLEKSESFSAPGAISMHFSHLVLDREKVRDHEFFRLAENLLIILVSDRIAQAITKIEPIGLSLTPIDMA